MRQPPSEAAAVRIARELGSGARAAFCDLLDVDRTARLLHGADVCLNAAQYDFNLHAMQACLEAGVPYLDLGGLFHMTRRQLAMDEGFRSRGLLAILGMGSCPGLSNVQAAYLAAQLDRVERLRIYNGSLPPEGDELTWGYSIRIWDWRIRSLWRSPPSGRRPPPGFGCARGMC